MVITALEWIDLEIISTDILEYLIIYLPVIPYITSKAEEQKNVDETEKCYHLLFLIVDLLIEYS